MLTSIGLCAVFVFRLEGSERENGSRGSFSSFFLATSCVHSAPEEGEEEEDHDYDDDDDEVIYY